MSEQTWDKLTRKFLSLFTQKEVKTPLSFFFRLSTVVSAIVLAALYVSDPSVRFKIFLVGIGLVLVLFFGVALFAWCRPKNLVYGETGHRAETKWSLGTEKKEIGPEELSALPGTTNTETTNTETTNTETTSTMAISREEGQP
jgi:hypothetical protein